VIPLGEVVTRIGAGKPSQNGAIGKKSGVITGNTVTDNLVGKVVTHCPAVGVNV
jgi:hypothetical protein